MKHTIAALLFIFVACDSGKPPRTNELPDTTSDVSNDLGAPDSPDSASATDTSTTDTSATTDTTDTDTGNDSATAVDIADSPPAPLVGEAFDCGVANATGGIAAASESGPLVRHTIDTALYPDALCNDGSPAIFYIRPARTEAARHKWVLELLGGGGCTSPTLCAKRWCSVDTNFSKTQMTSTTSPARTNGAGILLRPGEVMAQADNPFADYNHVLVKYCSSDTWRGTARDVDVEAPHPKTGAPTRFRIHFLGRRIIESTLDILRKGDLEVDGVPVPDLDSAEELIFAGASAGGGGVTFNLDWLKETLSSSNSKIEVYGLIDSTFSPNPIGLDYTVSNYCLDAGICTDEALMRFADDAQKTFWKAPPEASCERLRSASADTWKCASDTFVMLNHLTTPFFVRQGLNDGLISEPYVENGVRLDGVPFTMELFVAAVRDDLHALHNIPSTSPEAADMTVAPGVFGPRCPKHETLRSNDDTFRTTITPDSGTPRRMFDIWRAWRTGMGETIITSERSGDTTCP